jgi:hypothetical protein
MSLPEWGLEAHTPSATGYSIPQEAVSLGLLFVPGFPAGFRCSVVIFSVPTARSSAMFRGKWIQR